MFILIEGKFLKSKNFKQLTYFLFSIFITVSNRLEVDPFITDKLHFKKRKGEEGCCLLI